MSAQSSHSSRKQMHPAVQGSMQGVAPRESTPSPSFRERQRAAKAHSMPVVPSVTQLLSQSQQIIYPQTQQQPSPTMSNSSHQSRRTPPPTSRISPTTNKLAQQSVPGHPRERTPERHTPPPLVHAHSQPIVPLHTSMPPGPQHTQSTPNVLAQVASNPHHPRPINRVAPPQFLTQYQGADEKWQVTDELMAEIERADLQQAQGQFGVAYAGGAASSSASSLLMQHSGGSVSVKDPAVERVRAGDRASPQDPDSSGSQTAKRQMRDKDARESPKTRDRAQTVSSMSSLEGHTAANRSPEYRGSPQYQTPMASPGERTAAYTQYLPDGYQVQGPQNAASGPVPVWKPVQDARLTPPTSKLATSHTPPPQPTMAARPPDRSLPVQEEPEDDAAHYIDRGSGSEDRHRGSPQGPSDVYPDSHGARYDVRREHVRAASHGTEDDDDMTLNEEEDEHPGPSKNGEDSEAGFTPRSPSTSLPERPRDGPYANPNARYTPPNPNARYTPPNPQYQQPNGDYQKTVRSKHRSGPTDQLGIRSFDPTIFENTVNSLRGSDKESASNGQRQIPPQQPPQIHIQTQPQQPPSSQSFSDASRYDIEAARQLAASQRHMGYGGYPIGFPSVDDLQSLLEDPTSSYISSYMQMPGSRPNAPIPPTPHSQTAAPSPSPLISAAQSDAEPRPMGSPYPYPFTHIRRQAVNNAAAQAASINNDPNNPAVIREQLALQMQIYALNNGLAPPSDSTFSPPSTPFPGPGYNPWAFVPGFAGMRGSAMSMRSSPSHEPVPLPMPPLRGRGLRKRENVNVRAPQAGHRVKPPPRVESTQPRETSPEMSSGSGEETAGEEHFVENYAPQGGVEPPANGAWVNGHGGKNGVVHDGEGEDDGEWVDEEEDDEDELLDLEYHPSYINNDRKRRRRWEMRWEALTQAFQALDRETDATMVLLAAPSHSAKLHALTSRAVRRDPALYDSPRLAGMRAAFNQLARHRRSVRSQRVSLVERLQLSGSASSADGSPVSAESRDIDLRRALEAALGSLGEMNKIYEQREARWREEMRQLTDDRDRVQLLLRQVLGPVMTNGRS
ncbi:hypothetical protein WOLCODRAFT_137573 [Wolfiporia cocos MD-104 SS10]|uniref:Uncharacterized protein n=1 Tax=Wolfiporia cocos (strain MD-104) TaxID=742152 RepID=A0A2H3JJL7_WOLCO|nr:hypothetical protein WOLCODRAFT_137573 [Wolfiporia cocos MD-104 SS10]